MKWKNNISLICIGLLLSWNSYAQDFHLSQYDASPLNTNPALTGMFMGKHRVHIHYRTQWAAISPQPFTTIQAAWDMRIDNKWSIGLQAINYRAGSAHYNVASLLPSVSYSLPITANKYHRITMGVSAGFFSKSIDYDGFTWGSQFENNAEGGHFNKGINSGESIDRKNIFKPDFNFGAMYFYGRPDSKFNPFLGITIFHLSHPKESFLGNDSRLPLRYLLHAGTRIKVNNTIDVLPKIYWQMQGIAQEFTFSGEVDYFLEKPSLYLIGALTYRLKDAIIFEVGGKWKGWAARISYDFNVSKLTPYSQGRGATELSITYIIPAKQKPATTLLTCPRL